MNAKTFNPKVYLAIASLVVMALVLSACDPIKWPWMTRVEKAQVEATIAADAAMATQIAVGLTPGAPAGATPMPGATSAPGAMDARAQRLLSADANYRAQGAAAWARQLNFSFGSISQDARQPEEETFAEANGDSMVVVSGVQVRVTDLKAAQPACFTTDKIVNGKSRFLRPDNFDPIKNPSVLYTDNEVGFTGTATLWGDCSNWNNLMTAPLAVFTTTTSAAAYNAPAATSAPASTANLTLADLAKLGTIVNRLEYPAGTLAGAQILFNQDWSAPTGWTIQKNGSNVSSVQPGDIAAVWSPENVRPLKEK